MTDVQGRIGTVCRRIPRKTGQKSVLTKYGCHQDCQGRVSTQSVIFILQLAMAGKHRRTGRGFLSRGLPHCSAPSPTDC